MLLITTPTTTPSLVKTSLKKALKSVHDLAKDLVKILLRGVQELERSWHTIFCIAFRTSRKIMWFPNVYIHVCGDMKIILLNLNCLNMTLHTDIDCLDPSCNKLPLPRYTKYFVKVIFLSECLTKLRICLAGLPTSKFVRQSITFCV